MSHQPSQSLRTFLAIHLPEHTAKDIEARFSALREQLKAYHIRWHPPEKYHVTVRFCGETSPAQIDCLKLKIATELNNTPPFQVHFDPPRLFPSAKKRIAIVLPVKPLLTLLDLHTRSEAACQACEFSPETRPYLPHLTLGKIKDRRRFYLPAVVHAKPVHFVAKQVSLMHSVPSESKISYTPLYHFELKR